MALTQGINLDLWEPLTFPARISDSQLNGPAAWNYSTTVPKIAFPYISSSTTLWEYDCLANAWDSPLVMASGYPITGVDAAIEYDLSTGIYYLVNQGGSSNLFKSANLNTRAFATLNTPTQLYYPDLIHTDTTRHASGNDDLIFYFNGNGSTNNQKYSISGNSWAAVANSPTTATQGQHYYCWLPGVDATKMYFFVQSALSNGWKVVYYVYDIVGNTWGSVSANIPGTRNINPGSALQAKWANDGTNVYIAITTGSTNGGVSIYKISSIATTAVCSMVRELPDWVVVGGKEPRIVPVTIGSSTYLYMYQHPGSGSEALYAQFYRTLLF